MWIFRWYHRIKPVHASVISSCQLSRNPPRYLGCPSLLPLCNRVLFVTISTTWRIACRPDIFWHSSRIVIGEGGAQLAINHIGSHKYWCVVSAYGPRRVAMYSLKFHERCSCASVKKITIMTGWWLRSQRAMMRSGYHQERSRLLVLKTSWSFYCFWWPPMIAVSWNSYIFSAWPVKSREQELSLVESTSANFQSRIIVDYFSWF